MNPLFATGVAAGLSAGAMALARGGELGPTPAEWWLRARDLLRAEYGVSGDRTQTMDDLRSALQRRAVGAWGENADHHGYPRSGTCAELKALGDHWLGAFQLWGLGLVDAQVPREYKALALLPELATVSTSAATVPNTPASPTETYRIWRAVADLARAADARRLAEIKTGTTGDHPDSFFDYVGVGADAFGTFAEDAILWGPRTVAAGAESLAEGVFSSLGIGRTLLIGAVVVGGAYVAYKLITRARVPVVP